MRHLLLPLASTAILALAACERPTGPELVERIDRAEREMLSDANAERRLTSSFLGTWDLIRLLPNGRAEASLLTVIDGKEHWFKAFVFERVVIRVDRPDGYPCPLQERHLIAIEGSKGFMLRGSDFSQPIRLITYCGIVPGPAPLFWVARTDTTWGMVGVSGNARIDDAARTGGCDFLKTASNFPLKVDCELRDYEVQLDVGTQMWMAWPPGGLGSARSSFSVSAQRVPGLRLTIHCTEKEFMVEGCEPPPLPSY